MLAAGLVPMGIVGKSFRRDAELPAHIGKHRAGREFARFKRAARPSHIEQEHRKAEPGGIAATATDKFQIVAGPDRKSVVTGKSVSVSVDLGGRRNVQKKKIKT